MGGHAAWRKRVARGELAKGLGGAIMRHRPHRGRKGKDLILNRKGHIGGGNPKKKQQQQQPKGRKKQNGDNDDDDEAEEEGEEKEEAPTGLLRRRIRVVGENKESRRTTLVGVLLCIPVAYTVGFLVVYHNTIMEFLFGR